MRPFCTCRVGLQARFQYDALRRQRLNIPMVKGSKGLQPTTWGEAFAAIKAATEGVKGNQIKAIAGETGGRRQSMGWEKAGAGWWRLGAVSM